MKYYCSFICHSFCLMVLLMTISTVFLGARIIFQNQCLAVDSTAHYLCSHKLSYFPCAVLLVRSCSSARVVGTVSHCGTRTDTLQIHLHSVLVLIGPERRPGCLCQRRRLHVTNYRWPGEQNFRTLAEPTSSALDVVVRLCQS